MNLYWVGTRQSDIEDVENFFKGSITIYGSNNNGNASFCSTQMRINHNISNQDCDTFFEDTLNQVLETDCDAFFIFYNPLSAYNYNNKIQSRSLCLNNKDTLDMFSDKYRARTILSNIMDTIPFIVLSGDECTYENIRSYFINANEFVIQEKRSSGGEGTFHITEHTSIDFIVQDNEYIVSPYISNGVSINSHVIICDDEIIYFPASIQLIIEIDNRLLYNGADYISYDRFVSTSTKEHVDAKIKDISECVRARGYRGILGIDLLISKDNVYFIEFNPRFQASSHLINKALSNSHQSSLQQMNLDAFIRNNITYSPISEIGYSCYIYSYGNISLARLKRIVQSSETVACQFDGLDIDSIQHYEKSAYLMRCIFDFNISTISNGKLLIHPNIYTENINKYITDKYSKRHAYIKFALLNHGALLCDDAIELASKLGTIKNAVFDAIDARIFNSVYINIPCKCKLVSFSPFAIKASGNEFILWFNDQQITIIEIDFVPDILKNKTTKSGVPFESIINLATDRIRINPAPVCCFKSTGLSCKFCNLPYRNDMYCIDDIKEVIDYCLTKVNFRHFLIGGGSLPPNDEGWNLIIEIVSYIRNQSDRDIYLMTIPPNDLTVISNLINSGITEIAFNIEMFDRNKAMKYMPGKGRISLDCYISALKYAVKILGNNGRVRSLLIYGLDNDSVFLEGIEMLCKLGVEPIISVFRPLYGTDMSYYNPPSTEDIISMYEKCIAIANHFSLTLGPDCNMCQNNTLSFKE